MAGTRTPVGEGKVGKENRSERMLISRRRFLQSAALTSGALIGFACAPPAATPRAQRPAEAASRVGGESATSEERVRRVDFAGKAAISHVKSLLSAAPWTVGAAKGFFQEVGLTHEVTEFAGGGDTVRGLLLGGNHYALTAPAPSITAFVAGEPIRIIGSAFASTTISFLVKRDSPYLTIKDLQGRKIGYSTPASNTHFLATRANRDHQLRAELISVGGIPDSLTALRTGIVDCSWTAEPQPSRFEDELRVLFTAAEVVPNFAEFIITTTEQFARERPDVLRAFLSAYARTQTFIAENPEEAARIWAENAGIPPEIVVRAMARVPKEGWTLKLLPDMLKTVEASMFDFNQIEKGVDWRTLVIQDFLPADARTPLPT